MLYAVVLFLHSWLRWAVVVLGVLSLGTSLSGWLRGQDWTRADRRLQVFAVSAFDLQMLLGMTLYFALSPLTPGSMDALRTNLSVPFLRFFSLEHPLLMLLALVAVHLASAFSRRAEDAQRKHRAWAVGLILAVLCLALAIPWPGLSHGRPLFRGF